MRFAVWAVLAVGVSSDVLWSEDIPFVRALPLASDDQEGYVHVEYVNWWLRRGRVPPLLTTGPAESGGVLGEAGVEVLYGGERIETRHGDRFLGARFRFGWWLGRDPWWAVELGGFFLERDSTYHKTNSPGDPLLAIPYVDANTGLPAAEIVAGVGPEGLRNGSFNGFTKIELFGEEVNLVTPVDLSAGWETYLVCGLRCLQMRDRADFTATGRLLPDQAILFGVSDHVRIHNHFWGGQLGLRAERQWGGWFLRLEGDIALGATDTQVKLSGDRTRHTPLEKVVTPYGLFTQPSNRGAHAHTGFDTVVEVDGALGYRVTDWLSVSIGWTFLAWCRPLRAGDQIDTTVNVNQPGGPDRPEFPRRTDFFWATGVNSAVEVRW